ncbi:MAG TPA: septum formation family protein, partial [Micromonosporaceae bacterium]|nr:septum formation family protein [Micromonosporaceae bacterium]
QPSPQVVSPQPVILPQQAPPVGVEPVTRMPQPQVTSADGAQVPAPPRVTVVDPRLDQHTMADTTPQPQWAPPAPQWTPPAPPQAPWTPPPWPPPGTPPPGTPPPDRRTGRTRLVVAVVLALVLVAAGVVIWQVTSSGKPAAGPTPGPTVTTPSIPPSPPPSSTGPSQPVVPAGFQNGLCYGDNTLDLSGQTLWHGSGDEPTVPCTETHWLQVFSSGELPSSAANASSPPTASSSITREVYDSCTSPASVFLGGDWRLAFTWMVVVMPDEGAWDLGARWWACGLAATKDDAGSETSGSTDLADGLRGSKPAAMRCFNGKNDSTTKYETAEPTGCAGHHFAEVVGVYRAPAQAWPGTDAKVFEVGHKGCDSIFAKYVGVSSYGSAYMRSGTYYVNKESWTLGNRAFLCEAIAPGKSVSGSTKGIGSRHLGS